MPLSLRILKDRQLALAKQVQGFNFDQSRYHNRKCFEDALDVFFGNLHSDLEDLCEAHNFDAPEVSGNLSIDPEGGDDFYRQSLVMLTQALEELAAIAKDHDAATSEEEIAAMELRMQHFKDDLRNKLRDLRNKAKLFLAAQDAFDIKMRREILDALAIWEYLTFSSLLRMLKTGSVDWISG